MFYLAISSKGKSTQGTIRRLLVKGRWEGLLKEFGQGLNNSEDRLGKWIGCYEEAEAIQWLGSSMISFFFFFFWSRTTKIGGTRSILSLWGSRNSTRMGYNSFYGGSAVLSMFGWKLSSGLVCKGVWFWLKLSLIASMAYSYFHWDFFFSFSY